MCTHTFMPCFHPTQILSVWEATVGHVCSSGDVLCATPSYALPGWISLPPPPHEPGGCAHIGWRMERRWRETDGEGWGMLRGGAVLNVAVYKIDPSSGTWITTWKQVGATDGREGRPGDWGARLALYWELKFDLLLRDVCWALWLIIDLWEWRDSYMSQASCCCQCDVAVKTVWFLF